MKLATSYTNKVPGQEDYPSEGFGATIEVEGPDEQSREAAPRGVIGAIEAMNPPP